jgi:formyltetrahydrofolate hydrolase
LGSCPDAKGELATIADLVYRHNGNILHADEHADEESGLFLMRVEFDPKDRSFLNEFLCFKVRFAVSKGVSSAARKSMHLRKTEAGAKRYRSGSNLRPR